MEGSGEGGGVGLPNWSRDCTRRDRRFLRGVHDALCAGPDWGLPHAMNQNSLSLAFLEGRAEVAIEAIRRYVLLTVADTMTGDTRLHLQAISDRRLIDSGPVPYLL